MVEPQGWPNRGAPCLTWIVARRLNIEWTGGSVTGRLVGDGETGFLLAHGAGTNQDHPRMVGLRDALAREGLTVATFNYPYSEAGRRRPDSQATLLACHRAAASALRARAGSRLFLGGRSMGGRMGTYLAADGEPCAGVVLFAYPLHPPGRPEKLRADHLSSISAPMLFVQGTRDALCRMELLERHLRSLEGARIELIDGADHSFRLPGVSPADMDTRLATIAAAWIAGIVDHRA
jgi:predicted alpha/beta-hydrolase family hydrolase